MDLELIKRKATQMERALKRIRAHQPKSLKEFQMDFDGQDIIYRNFQIVVQNAVDMGSHVISEKGLPIPKSMGNVFDILGAHKVISPSLAKELRKMVTLRNIIVHDYTRIDHKKVFHLLKEKLPLLSKYTLSLLKL